MDTAMLMPPWHNEGVWRKAGTVVLPTGTASGGSDKADDDVDNVPLA
jgi:hypothetical protein